MPKFSHQTLHLKRTANCRLNVATKIPEFEPHFRVAIRSVYSVCTLVLLHQMPKISGVIQLCAHDHQEFQRWPANLNLELRAIRIRCKEHSQFQYSSDFEP